MPPTRLQHLVEPARLRVARRAKQPAAGAPTTGRADTERVLLRLASAALLATVAVIHAWLWAVTGYRYIPTIGWLFLLLVVACGLLAVLLVLARPMEAALAAAVGAGSCAGAIVALVVAAQVGLFGFHESWAVPLAIPSLVVEAVGVVACAATAARVGPPPAELRRRLTRRRSGPARP